MDIQLQLNELILVTSYGTEFRNTNNLFIFIDKVIKDDVLNTLKLDESKERLKSGIISILNSISRVIIQELKEDKYHISERWEIKNGGVLVFYFDKKRNEYLTSRHDTYPTNNILLYRDKIVQETEDFIGKKEVLDTFYQAYLKALAHEATIESIHCREVDSLLDLFNNPRYKEVRENAIASALSDKIAEQLPLSEIKFKDIEEATNAYEKDQTPENLAQLKKLYIIDMIQKTENCNDYDLLGNLLSEAKFDCVKRVVIKRLAYLDTSNSH